MSEIDATAAKLHGTTDAQVWAREFMKIARREIRCPDCGVSGGIDEGWMIVWFANAIEAGRDAGARYRQVTPAEEADDARLMTRRCSAGRNE